MSKVKEYIKDNFLYLVMILITDIIFGYYASISGAFTLINIITLIILNVLCFISGKIDLSEIQYYIINSVLSLFIVNIILGIDTLSIGFLYIVLSFFVILSLYLFFNIFKINNTIIVILTNIILIIFSLIGYYVLHFRGTPLIFRDLLTFKTALSVSSNYNFNFETSFITALLVFLFLIVFSFKIVVTHFNITFRLKRFLSIGFIVIYSFELMGGVVQDSNALNKYGPIVTFIGDYKNLEVNKPSDYNKDSIKNILSEGFNVNKKDDVSFIDIFKNKSKNKEVKNPNIIVIMSEALFDYEHIMHIETNEDYMPFLHNFKNMKNTYTGFVTTPVLGGGTCNSEFEFLTNHSLSFFGRWVYPYQDHLKQKQDSIVGTLNSYGYNSIAVHAFKKESWNRENVYDYFGFSDFITQEDFDSDTNRIRDFITDEEMFDKIIEIDEKEEGPLFVFGVTMQNHGGYEYGYKNNIKLINNKNGKYNVANEYFSLLKHSDDAFKKLIEHYQNVEDDTIILMFGDHSPAFVYNNLIDDPNVDVNSLREHYDTPFYLWANYDIEGGYNENISLNYLNLLLFDNANLELNNYQKYLAELYNTYPNINIFMDVNNDENLKEYKNLQYYKIFDEYKDT